MRGIGSFGPLRNRASLVEFIKPNYMKTSYRLTPRERTLLTAFERFSSGYSIEPSGCWIWQRSKNPGGYGYMQWVRPDVATGKGNYAHVFAYYHFVGPVPTGLELDHKCRHTSCVNPNHLEPVTHSVNVRRSPIHPAGVNGGKTHCNEGHEFTEENTYKYFKRGLPRRACITCRTTKISTYPSQSKERMAARARECYLRKKARKDAAREGAE